MAAKPAARWWLELAQHAWAGACAGAFTGPGWRVVGWVAPCAGDPMTLPDVGAPAAALAGLRELAMGDKASALLLAAQGDCRAELARRGDAPELIWVRAGQASPVAWADGADGWAMAQLELGSGDWLVSVSAAYPQATGWDAERLAAAVRRWIETGTDATQLADCLIRTGQRLAQSLRSSLEGAALWAARLRPLLSATVWTGPPSDPTQDRALLEALLAEPGTRIICGDTTAQIAARLLGRELVIDQRELAQAEVPPSAQLEGVHLVTEGLITLRHAAEWLRGARTVRDLPRNVDASTRLARHLMAVDEVRFLVGAAVNPAQVDGEAGGAPQRLAAVDELVAGLRALGKVVLVQRY